MLSFATNPQHRLDMHRARLRTLIGPAIFGLSGVAGYLGLSALIGSPTTALPTTDASIPANGSTAAQWIGDLRKSALVAEWERLRSRHGRAAGDFPGLYEVVKQVNDPFRQSALLAAVLAEWSEVDPSGALIYLRAHDFAKVHQLLREWLRRAPDAAMDAILAGDTSLRESIGALLSDVARRAPARLPEALDAMPPSFLSEDTRPRDAFKLLAERDLAAARVLAEKMTGAWQVTALSAVARAWVASDPAAALAWAKALPDPSVRASVQYAVFLEWSKTEPLKALNDLEVFLTEVPAGFNPGSLLPKTLRGAALHDWTAALAWAQKNPHRAQWFASGLGEGLAWQLKADLPGTLQWLAGDAPEGMAETFRESLRYRSSEWVQEAWKWLRENPRGARTEALETSLLEWVVNTDLATASGMLAQVPDRQELAQRAATAMLEAESKRHWAMSNTERLEALLAKSPAEFRPMLLRQSFWNLGSATGPEAGTKPQELVSRLGELPKADRLDAVPELASFWAGKEPAAASQWALALPDANERAAAFAMIFPKWVQTNRDAALAFFETLPVGAERDLGLECHVHATLENHPNAAWEWALEINDPARRALMLKQVYRGWKRIDPANAQAAWESASLPSAARETQPR